jgi:hypothetical protein
MRWELREAMDDAWRAAGRDLRSVVADPGFVDLEARDFRVAPGGPAEELGIRVPDISTAGARPVEERTHPLRRRTLADVPIA